MPRSKDLIAAMQKKYPKFSKATLCMVRNKEYGVQLSTGAKKHMINEFPELDTRKPRKITKKRLAFYVDDDIYDKVKKDIEEYLEREIGNGDH